MIVVKLDDDDYVIGHVPDHLAVFLAVEVKMYTDIVWG